MSPSRLIKILNLIAVIIVCLTVHSTLILAANDNDGLRQKPVQRFNNNTLILNDKSKIYRNSANIVATNSSLPTSRTTIATRTRTTTTTTTTSVPTNLSLERKLYQEEPDDYRVPFYNIAHMINSIGLVEPALREGANGIEVDISFNKKGIPVETYHGFPCDCARHCHHREDFGKFIRHIANITTPPEESSNLQVILFDLKLKNLGKEQKKTAGKYLATVLHENLYKKYINATKGQNSLLVKPPVRVVVSINHAVDSVLVHSFIDYMRKNQLIFMSQQVGFDVGMNDPLGNISAMWNELNGITYNIWQGDGLTNCANVVRGVERLKEAISIRNAQGHFRKVYYWTVDIMYHIRSVLRLGLDAVLTNQPKRVVQVLNEPEFNVRYRLATPYDDPFAQFWIQPTAWKMSPPTLGEVVETVTNIRKSSANFVKTIPDGISAAIEKVHSSISLIR